MAENTTGGPLDSTMDPEDLRRVLIIARGREHSTGVYVDEAIGLSAKVRRRLSDLRNTPYEDEDSRTRVTLVRELEYVAHMADKIRLLCLDEVHVIQGRAAHLTAPSD